VAETDITKTQLDVELGSVKTHLRAGNYASAKVELACARATLAGLAQEKGDQGATLRYREDINELSKLIADAESSNAADASNRADFTRGRPV
jgi:hypothetical protein